MNKPVSGPARSSVLDHTARGHTGAEALRVFIITQDEPVYAPRYVAKIVQAVTARHTVVGITALPAAGRMGWPKLARQRLAMYGAWDFFRVGCMVAYCKARSLFPPRKRPYSVRQIAVRHAIPLYACKDVNDPRYIASLRALEVDVLISVAANQKFRRDLLRVPRRVCLNVHSSLLPRYRGVDGLFWALAHGESEVGVSVHVMTENFDEGGIVAQQPLQVMPEDSLHRLYLKAIDLGAALIAGSLELFRTDAVVLRDNSGGSYFSWPTRSAARRFRAHGRRFL